MSKARLMTVAGLVWLWSWWPVMLGYQFDSGRGAALGMIVRALYIINAERKTQT